LPYLPKDIPIWEPACGTGNLVNVLRKHGHKVLGTDVSTGNNFFYRKPPMQRYIHVTNPPYSLKYPWIQRCYALGQPFALLVPVETMGSQKAQVWTQKFGVELMFLWRRVNFIMPYAGATGSAQFPVMWMCWNLLPREINYGMIEYR